MTQNEPMIKTSLINVTSKLTSYSPKCQYFFKLENEQPSKSFKLRGIGHLIHTEVQKSKEHGYFDKLHVFASSGGNAGLAAAFASQYYDVGCTVVIPRVSYKPKVGEQLESFGAKVIIHGEHWGEADAYLKRLVMEGDGSLHPVFCHPFDHELIWEGHSTIIDEIVEDFGSKCDNLKGVVVSVGGGGLYNGVIEGLDRNGLSKVPVLAVETEPAPTFTKAVEANKVVVLDSVKTIATSLASPYISSQSLRNYHSHPTIVKLIKDNDAIQGTVGYYKGFNQVIEPACGATTSIAMTRSDLLKEAFGPLGQDDIVVFIVCGGAVYSLEDVEKLCAKLCAKL